MTRRTDSGTGGGVRAALAVVGLVAIGILVTASAVIVADRGAGPRPGQAAGTVAVIAENGVPDAVLVTRMLLASSSSAVVVPAGAAPEERARAVELSRNRRVPVYTVPAAGTGAVTAELRRLGVSSVVNVGGEVAGLGVTQTSDTSRIGRGVVPFAGHPVVLLDDSGDDAAEAAADAGLADAQVVRVPVADPRATGESVAAVSRAGDPAILAFGAAFGDEETFRVRVRQARTVPQLPGGGQLMFPSRRVVALYGSPGSRELGPLGRQSLPASIDRAKAVAAQYDSLSPAPVVPGFEIIVTVASAEPGYRGAYTNVVDPAVVEPWIDAAEKAGIYVTLDLQPGRMDFLTQAKMYQRLLERPHVGLALDPEWRLKPGQVHLTQIGSVDPAEVNRTSAWLADLVRTRNLPQKAFVLHQFDVDMLGDRSRIDTSHPELAVVLHADGHGVPAVKMGTWNRMISGMPPNVWMGWKNFYTEDKPMFGPGRTMAVRPVPYFISYQ
ncbi:hypothetical protein [Gordonia sp. (in: high G+C Gram-positive bacteria)]|uniref:hypothetical protein n=1 Tax=Gordonia sp. (in: high G+C Gram-positive bacteria) TaxID=84139 RepID=UPI0035272EBA